MTYKPRKLTPEQRAKIQAELHRDLAIRQTSYRERALSLFSHICGRCGREFSGKRLKELTVHHRDHNHDNNPNDGSNWELLCIYCHDHEHEKFRMKGYAPSSSSINQSLSPSIFSQFGNLDSMIKVKPADPPPPEPVGDGNSAPTPPDSPEATVKPG